MSKNLVNGDSLKKYHIGFIEKYITPLINKTNELSDLNEESANKIDELQKENQKSKKHIETLLDKVSKFTDGDMSLNKLQGLHIVSFVLLHIVGSYIVFALLVKLQVEGIQNIMQL